MPNMSRVATLADSMLKAYQAADLAKNHASGLGGSAQRDAALAAIEAAHKVALLLQSEADLETTVDP